MPLTRERYIVHLAPLDDGEPTEHRVTVTHQDMLRGELEHSRAGCPPTGAYLNLTTAWLWAALTREGHYTRPFLQFRDMDCAGIEDDGQADVDPTHPATIGGSA